MTQLFRAAAPYVVPCSLAEGRISKPSSRGSARVSKRFVRAASLLAIAGLAGCADSLTDSSQQPFSTPQMVVSGSDVVGEYPIPIPANSLHGTSTVDWTNTGITVPRAGKYRIRVQGVVTASQHPLFPGPCPAVVPAAYAGDWGPMGRPELGTHLRVAVYTQRAQDWGFPVRVVGATTIETEQQLEANTQIWVARQGLGLQLTCSEHPSPVPVFAFSGSQTLTVEEILEPKLECKGADGNTEIERGQTVRCTITPDKPYKVLSRRATGTGFAIPEEPGTSHAANTQYVWEGPAVAKTEVKMVIETSEEGGPKQTTHLAVFTVRARDWPKLQLSAPNVQVLPRSNMPAYPVRGVLGVAVPFIPTATLNALPVTRAPGGPNQGLSFLTDPLPPVSHNIYLHPGLERRPSTPLTDDQVWRNDQNGQGDGDCTSSVFSLLRKEIERHEGVTRAANSHWGITDRFFREQDPEQRLEEQVLFGDEASLRQQVGSVFGRLISTGPHKQEQVTFDRVDRARVDARLGCRLDYKQNDGG
jgi:hypothetical protein